MFVSVNPSYLCNFRCKYCYLTPEQLSDRTVLPIELLLSKLDSIPNLEGIELYGKSLRCLLKITLVLYLKDMVRPT